MKRIPVLIVDGSSTTREMLRQSLGRDPGLEVVAVTASGRMALSKLTDLTFAVVVLDVALPDREGLKTLAAIREVHPDWPVIMLSRLTSRGSQTTLDALQLGATDYVTKPESTTDLELCIRGELTAKIKSLGAGRGGKAEGGSQETGVRTQGTDDRIQESGDRSQEVETRPGRPAELVAIATSTGGPNALASLLSSLPASFATPIVVVQHMAAGFTASLAESLCRQTGRIVREADRVQPLHAAAIWIAAGGRHLVLSRDGVTVQVAPNDGPAENECRPSADVMLRSVVNVFGSRCLAVVLTGIGCDGLAGCRAVRQAGGTVLVQDEASSVAWGMPGQIATAGLADRVVSLRDLPREICRLTRPLESLSTASGIQK